MVKYLLFIPLVLVSCSTGNTTIGWEKTPLEVSLLDSLIDIKNVEESNRIIIIPEVGCTGCISNALNYFHQSRNREEIFIFTSILDMRMFRQEIAEELWSDENIIVDSLNYLNKVGFESSYPLFIKYGKDGYLYKKIFDINTLN